MFFERLLLLDRIDRLIQRRQTGSPKELSERLNVSKRTVYRLIEELRVLGLSIEFDRVVNSYVYQDENTFSIVVNDQLYFKGGMTYVEYCPNFMETSKVPECVTNGMYLVLKE